LQFLPEVRCADGWASPSIGRQGACSHHGGVRGNGTWLVVFLGLSISGGTVAAHYFKPKDLGASVDSSEPTELINSAIASGKKIEFVYKKRTALNSEIRTILPSGFKRVAHKRAHRSTFCVVGYCELRKAERTFALERMSNIRVL
jgi:hypothetical protein